MNTPIRILPVLVSTILVFAIAGCDSGELTSGEEDEDENEETDTTMTFDGPRYPDDYTSISSWWNRSEWNLANVHDPTVVRDGEYYYMYQTDASYGNVHEGHGHYPYRRSTDLVNWEYRGPCFPVLRRG